LTESALFSPDLSAALPAAPPARRRVAGHRIARQGARLRTHSSFAVALDP
jgi:hypothetical protein